MGDGDGIVVPCGTCGPVTTDPALVERHHDPTTGFALATFLCPRCGELGASRRTDLLHALERNACVAVRKLTVTSRAGRGDELDEGRITT